MKPFGKNNKISFDNTANVQYFADMAPKDFLAIPAGKEKQIFKIDQIVVSTGTGCLIPNVSVMIEDVIIENGYVKYFGNGMWHNQNDLKPKISGLSYKG